MPFRTRTIKMVAKSLAAVGVATILSFGPASDAAADGMVIQTSNMHDFNTGEDVAGGGIMRRSENEVWVTLSTSGLDRKAAYTVWWIVFNNPDQCSDPCGLDDLVNGAVNPAAYYAGGFVTGTDGTAHVDLHAASGAIPDGADDLLGSGTGLDDDNGFAAEIHLIVRSHGGIKVGSVDLQIGSFAGECGPAPDFPKCADQQAIAFLPVAD